MNVLNLMLTYMHATVTTHPHILQGVSVTQLYLAAARGYCDDRRPAVTKQVLEDLYGGLNLPPSSDVCC